MPSHCHCVVPNCSNRKSGCKYGLFIGDDGCYEKRRLCGDPAERKGCGGSSPACKDLSFHRLPSDTDLRKQWLAAIPRTNTPLTSNSYVCGQHFLGGKRARPDNVPKVFVGKRAVRPRTTRTSTGRQALPRGTSFGKEGGEGKADLRGSVHVEPIAELSEELSDGGSDQPSSPAAAAAAAMSAPVVAATVREAFE